MLNSILNPDAGYTLDDFTPIELKEEAAMKKIIDEMGLAGKIKIEDD